MKGYLLENTDVTQAIETRRSMRAFLPNPVAPETVERILEVASRSPSGSNIQPWHVDVLTGETLEVLKSRITQRYDSGDYGNDEYEYYPRPWYEPYLERRRATGWGLYGLLGIERKDKDKMVAQLRRNYVFFDAPVGLIFSLDKQLERGSWIDYGMFLQSTMVAARAFGLHTCPQQAFAAYHDTVRDVLGIPEDRYVLCGMSLGEVDMNNIVNSLELDRVSVGEFAKFHD